MTLSRRGLLRHGAGVVGGIGLAGCNVLDAARRQDHVLNTPSLSAADRVAILGDNARRLLNLPA